MEIMVFHEDNGLPLIFTGTRVSNLRDARVHPSWSYYFIYTSGLKQIHSAFLVNQNDIGTFHSFLHRSYFNVTQGHMLKSKTEDTTVKKNFVVVI